MDQRKVSIECVQTLVRKILIECRTKDLINKFDVVLYVKKWRL